MSTIESIVRELDAGRISITGAVAELQTLVEPPNQRLMVAAMMVQGLLAGRQGNYFDAPADGLKLADELIKLERSS